ncbi:MAG: hypothetical protein AAF429_09265 [Pseudomonadota bacterium]
MKKIAMLATVASFAAASAFAGTLSEPVITEVEEPAPAGSSAGSAPWLLLLLAAAVVVAADD